MRFSFLQLLFLALFLTIPSYSLKRLHTSNEKQIYLNKLVSIEQTLSQYLTELKNMVDYVSNQSQLFEGYDSLQTQVLQQAFLQYRDKLIEIQRNTQIPYQLKKWECKIITANQRDALESNIQEIKNFVRQLENLQTSSNLVDSCLRNQQLKFNAKMLDVKVSSLENDLSNVCLSPSSTNGTSARGATVKIPNLSTSANNWVYGTYSVDEYSQKIDELAMNGSTQQCPDDKPFVSVDNDCFTCPQIYDISQKKCTSCKVGTALNINTHQCEIKKQNVEGPQAFKCPEQHPYWNTTACIKCQSPGSFDNVKMNCICGQGLYYNFVNQVCQQKLKNKKNSYTGFVNYKGNQPNYDNNLETCPEETPIWDGENCIKCELPNYFDFESKECRACQNEKKFDIVQKRCVVPATTKNKRNSNLGNTNNYAGQVPQQDNNVEDCPPNFPYFNGKDCISCNRPQFFDFSTWQCKVCENGKTFNEVTKSCGELEEQKILYRSNQDNAYNSKGTPKENYDGINVENIKTCSDTNPYFNGKQCISCSLPSYFNFESRKCQSCIAEQRFDKEKKQCVKIEATSSQLNSYLVSAENFKGTIPKYNTAVGSCSDEKPFFNGKQCIACSLPRYFNMEIRKCENCPQEQQFFNIVSKMCQYSTQKYITDIKNENIYYNGDFAAVINNMELKKKGDTSIQICPNDNPFYNPGTGTCISCPESTPLFDIKYNQCIKCREGSYFNSEQHVCISEGVVSPTIQRMMMNSISLI